MSGINEIIESNWVNCERRRTQDTLESEERSFFSGPVSAVVRIIV